MATTQHTPSYPTRHVPITRPFVWLMKAWDDVLHHRGASLAYGLLVTVLGMVVLGYQQHPFYVAVVTTGFLLIGPIIGAGVCELSRAQDHGEATDFGSSLGALRRHRHALMRFAEALFVVAVVWFFASGIMLQGMTGAAAPTLESTVWGDVMRQLSRTQVVAYLLTGGILACMVLALSVITVPMIIDRHVDAGTAMRTSIRVTLAELPAMVVWGLLIVFLVVLGFATSLIAMVLFYPLLGHATWYAYRDLLPD